MEGFITKARNMESTKKTIRPAYAKASARLAGFTGLPWPDIRLMQHSDNFTLKHYYEHLIFNSRSRPEICRIFFAFPEERQKSVIPVGR